MAEFWIRPATLDKQLMFCFSTDDEDEAVCIHRAMETGTKDYGGFQQISVPNSPCPNHTNCDTHWFCCPGWYGWELWGSRKLHLDVLFRLFCSIQKDAQLRLADYK